MSSAIDPDATIPKEHDSLLIIISIFYLSLGYFAARVCAGVCMCESCYIQSPTLSSLFSVSISFYILCRSPYHYFPACSIAETALAHSHTAHRKVNIYFTLVSAMSCHCYLCEKRNTVYKMFSFLFHFLRFTFEWINCLRS